jgi:hypothetical protein
MATFTVFIFFDFSLFKNFAKLKGMMGFVRIYFCNQLLFHPHLLLRRTLVLQMFMHHKKNMIDTIIGVFRKTFGRND